MHYFVQRLVESIGSVRLYYGYFALAVICVVLTGSRSSFVALLALMLIWVAVQQGKRKLLVLVSTILAIMLFGHLCRLRSKTVSGQYGMKMPGLRTRRLPLKEDVIGWKVSWRMFKRAPLTGVGAGGDNFIGVQNGE